MKTLSDPLEAVGSVSSEKFERYLRDHAWKRRGKPFRGARTWTKSVHRRAQEAILVPTDRTKSDYASVMRAAILTVAEIEQEDPGAIAAAFREPENTLIRMSVSKFDTASTSISLTTANSVLQSFRDLVLRAAEVAAVMTGLEAGRAHQAALRYLARVELVATELGSFRLTGALPLVLPVPSKGPAEVPSVFAAQLRHISSLPLWEQEHADPSTLLRLESEPMGRATALALARLDADEVERVEIETPLAGPTGSPGSVVAVFTAEDLRFAREMTDRSREQVAARAVPMAVRPSDQQGRALVRGKVVELKRPSVVVDGGVEFHSERPAVKRRRIVIRGVPPRVYGLALEAHAAEAAVEASGFVIIRARSAQLDDLTDFRIVD